MKRILLFTICILLLHLASPSAKFQTRAEIGATASVSGGLGYENPNLGITGGALTGNPNAALDLEASYFYRAHKYTDDGTAYPVIALGRYYPTAKFHLTGGV
jgi:hypothetical protein